MELPVNIAPLQPNGKPVKVELNSGDKVCPHASRIRPVRGEQSCQSNLRFPGQHYGALNLVFRCFVVSQLYSEIRDMNFSRVGVLLSQRARMLSKEYDGEGVDSIVRRHT
jgi:hypothetical protein